MQFILLLRDRKQSDGFVVAGREQARGRRGRRRARHERHVEHHVCVARERLDLLAASRVPDVNEPLDRARVHDRQRRVPDELDYTGRVLAHVAALVCGEIPDAHEAAEATRGSPLHRVAKAGTV